MRNCLIYIAASVLAAAAPASAQTIGFNGADEIARGDYARAEQVIAQTRKLFPAYPELMLNLALVYRHTGRSEQARALYQEVLRQPDAELDVRADRGTARAHAIAIAGLAITKERIAAR